MYNFLTFCNANEQFGNIERWTQTSPLPILHTRNKNLAMTHPHSSDNESQALISAKEMIKISNEISRKYSPAIPSPAKVVTNQATINTVKSDLPTQNLRQVSDNISLYYAPKLTSTTKKLTLLSIDPQHIYIYWNLGTNRTTPLLQTMHNDGLVLKIHSLTNQGQIKNNLIYELPVHSFQYQEKIKIPVTCNQIMYSASIGKYSKNRDFVSLVRSNDLHIYKGEILSTTPSVNKNTSKLIDNHSFFDNTQAHFASNNHSGQRIHE